MADSRTPVELDRLLARLVDESATTTEIAALEAMLQDDAALRRYVHYLDLHAELRGRAQSGDALGNPLTTVAKSSSRIRVRRVAVFVLAATLLLAFGVWAGRGFESIVLRQEDAKATNARSPDAAAENGDGGRMDDGVAVLTQAVDAVWQMRSAPLPGSTLPPQRLQLVRGTVQVEFFSGAVVLVEGPADLELVSTNRAICRHGRLRGVVPPQARGFTIFAPDTELVDLGTQFGMDIPPAGPTNVHVFEGEVELLPPAPREPRLSAWKITAGETVRIDSRGKPQPVAKDARSFASFDLAESSARTRGRQRFQAWKIRNERQRSDPRLAVLYDFELRSTDVRTLHDQHAERSAADGTIIGCGRAAGRWPDKSALEFRRSSDRVRCELPGRFDALTLTAWVRVDSLDDRLHGLLLTDGYEIGRPHWQLTSAGELRLGIRVPDVNGKLQASGYGSPVIFDSQRLGVWTFLATVYDRGRRSVEHWVDGRLVARHELVCDQPLEFGLMEIGNWGVPLSATRHPVRNLNGCIDEFAVWGAALKTDEITTLFEVGQP